VQAILEEGSNQAVFSLKVSRSFAMGRLAPDHRIFGAGLVIFPGQA